MELPSTRKQINPYENLERMLNKTTMTTQRVAHRQIIDVGEFILSNRVDNNKEQWERQTLQMLAAAEARATRELRAAIKRLRIEKDEEKKRAIEKQKEYFERLAKRIEEQRDKAEEERVREVTKKLNKEKEVALQTQWEECERIKDRAVEEACAALTKVLRSDFAIEKEKAIMNALKQQKEKFLMREKDTIERTIKECEEKARREAERVAKLHEEHVDRLNQKYNALEQKYMKELDHKKRVEKDFRELQDDYRRFMDYTDGKFHSDYLIRLRHLGMRLADKRISEVEYDDIPKLF